MTITQKVAFVAGGSGGIGAAIVHQLAREGSDVAFTYHANAESAAEVAEEVRSLGRRASVGQLDLQDAPAVKAFVDEAVRQFGRLDSVVYAAGPKFDLAFINQIDPPTWARVLRSDIEGCFNLVWACLPHLKQQRSGSIVAVITAAVDRPPPRDILSAAPKAAIQALIRGVAREEARFGIRANCVGPGWIDAGLGAEAMSASDQTRFVDQFTSQIPMRRVGHAEEVAETVAFLLSDRAGYLTGVTVPVAGGLQL